MTPSLEAPPSISLSRSVLVSFTVCPDVQRLNLTQEMRVTKITMRNEPSRQIDGSKLIDSEGEKTNSLSLSVSALSSPTQCDAVGVGG